MSTVNDKMLKSIFKKNLLIPILFDHNKYQNHIEAFQHNDYKTLDVEYTDKYQDTLDYYNCYNEAVTKSNEMLNSNLKIAVPLYHINTYNSGISNFYTIPFDSEFEVISQCFNFIFDNLGKSLLLNNKGIQVANLDEDNLESFANDILFEDYKNNISLKGQSISYLFNLIVTQNIDIKKVKEIINYKNF
tara:strand:+ start:9851 stop:10417 length:567 start_codon:yes stop_codon:yes gene_type:complete